METREKRPYNKWSQTAKRIVDIFIDGSITSTPTLQSVLGNLVYIHQIVMVVILFYFLVYIKKKRYFYIGI